ncbi:cupin domain-containing protein [Paralimibaculum aggregatum]|uniref:Cupin domain-containing protein n=1 Tax=Paralimibaculum aggregatum TaxID=3036245 RepID=A0ABQ6LNQ5_9RHOB|nr:cupin domain-containing protein [Limibaculum sp. NKW23]GMG83915.1 cupin domain-containing protein [Limibaculum sp. NKW23]
MQDKRSGQDTTAEPSIGDKLRMLRKGHALSLKELSSRAQISIGALSQIERGISSPSIRTLNKLATSFAVPLSYFFAESDDAEADGIVVRQNRGTDLAVSAQGIAKRLLTPQALDGLQLMLVSMEPASSSGPEAYGHPGLDAGYVLSGALRLEVEGRIYLLTEGDSFGFVSTRPHRFECVGERGAEIIWINTQ